MKNIFSRIILGASIFLFGAAFSSCTEEMVDINDEIALGRCMTPTELVATIKNGEFIEFSWTKSKGATEFLLELYSDEQMTSKVAEKVILADEIPYTWDLDADMVYYARVKAVDGNGHIKDSNWAVYDRQLETYAIKSSLNPELVDRTVNSITIKWTKDPEVDHIRVTPAVNAEDEYTRFDVSSAAVSAGQVEVTGLNPSVYYTLAVHFKSADRGKLSAWTRPEAGNAVRVENTEQLLSAITSGEGRILLGYSETPYNVQNQVISSESFVLLGESLNDGNKPVVNGMFTFQPSVKDVLFESVAFDGLSDSNCGSPFFVAGQLDMTSFVVRNCNITNYVKGVFRSESFQVDIANWIWDGVYVSDVEGNSGDTFDLRKYPHKIGQFIVKNSTFTNGMRSFFRINKPDTGAAGTIDKFSVTNCTFNNLAVYDNSNNHGIFYIQAVVAEFELARNLFLNMNAHKTYTTFLCRGKSDAARPTVISDNFFYGNSDVFYALGKDASKVTEDEIKAAAEEGKATLTAGGGSVLKDDPCVDSARDKYNVISKEVISANAGDPRWFETYVEVPEDLTQTVTATGKIWNLTDGQTFKKFADKDMVRDGIRFYVKNTPINFVKTGFEFSGAATVGEDGIPTDGAIGIKVNEPGSIVISVAESSAHSNLTVSLDGKIAAAVPAGAEYQKVTFANVSGEQMIYIYGCHPATMTFLQWTSDVQVLDKVLATPVVKINKTTVNERADDNITLTWDAIDYAGSYNVTVDGKKKNVTETTYTFSTAAYKVEPEGGDFAIQVTAVPASDDYTRVESAAAELSFHVNDVPEEAGEVAGIAGVISFADYVGTASAGTLPNEFEAGSIKLSIVADDAKKMAVDANTCAFGTADATTTYTHRFKTGATSGTASALKLTVAAKGTIKIAVRTGSNSAVRNLKVVNAGVEILACALDENVQKHASASGNYYDYFTADVDAGEYDLTYDAGSVNIYAIEYIPAPVGPVGVDGVISFADYVGTASAGTLLNEFEAGSIKLSIVADDAKKMAVDANTCAFGTADATTTYTHRFKTGATSGTASALKLTVAAKGTIKIAVRTGSNSAVRNLKVVNAGVEILACALDENVQKHASASGNYYDYFTADVDAGEYDLTYDAGAVNIYAIEYVAAK